ncbi:MAG: DUF4159 domain-containing protein [Planctomycetes bacterium]|nr:DUF4159 domain-containing protein [Planctomycetota bacterium]
MHMQLIHRGSLVKVLVVGILIQAAEFTWAQADQPPAEPPTGPIRVALLTYARGKTTRCFTASFLAEVDRRTTMTVDHEVQRVELSNAKLYEYPFAILAGKDMFTLTSDQRRNLRHFIQRGGFLMASPNCASHPWQSSFRRELKEVLPEAGLTKLDYNHPIFHVVDDIEALAAVSGKPDPPIYAIEYQGRVVGVFSPNGLNETDEAGEVCECCCGHEIAHAGLLKVNLLAYALTH